MATFTPHATTHNEGITLDASVMARLRAVARRARFCVLIEGAARTLGFVLAAAVVQFLFDYGTRGLQLSIRVAMLLVIVAGIVVMLRRHLLGSLSQPIGPAEVAKLVERRYPHLSSLLISAIRFAGGESGPDASNSRDLMRSVVASAGPTVRGLDFLSVVQTRRARRSAFALAGMLAVGAAAALASPDLVGLWFARNVLLQDVDYPKRTHLVVVIDGEVLIGARGDDLTIEAFAEGVQPREVEISFETSSGKRGREPMVTVGGEGAYRYRYTLKNAQEDFTFQLRGGDDVTDRFRARLLDRPRVTRTEMRIVPPAYTRLDPLMLPDGQRSAQLLPGSEVTIWIETNKPVMSAVLMSGGEAADMEARVDGNRRYAVVMPHETRTYHFRLVDEVNLENRQPVRFALRVAADDPPVGRLQLIGVGNMITPEAVLPIQIEFSDQYGLAQVDLLYRLSREAETEGDISLPTFKPGITTFAATLEWPVASRGVVPGEVLTLHAQAADYDDVSGPNISRTPEHTLRIVTRDELIAELQRREQEYRMDFERLVDAQEDLRGRLLTVYGQFESGKDAALLAGELTGLERRQRNIAGSVNVIRQQFEQILSEMRVNRLDTAEERERLGVRIIEPLTDLSRRELSAAADGIRRFSRDGAAEAANAVDPQQVAILSRMRAVLESMIQWEGYQEVVGMLRDIIRLQQELRQETQRALEDQASDVFDD
jgi:hypothetical protein